ncbi:cupredoxin family copper-binding protein [Burkholderia sp. AU30198]|uniref:cupredoxin domain-containing protein n=1 Tax=Burkholderia sp. AU30198 TaxID=2879627 RepID=UPI001CF24F92|nr:cupredoxin family copper-binding protein [Burkholderia sp. AU30198]MCA8295613.1 cupredoxin family copper-binding protein [Burkholderia sp. AU30198]
MRRSPTEPGRSTARRAVCRIVAAAALALAAADVAAGTTHRIIIEGMRFNPASLTVERGDTVVWVNKDLVAHTATAAGVFDSHEIAPDASWTYVANAPGRHAYICTFHPTMKATLTVKRKP